MGEWERIEEVLDSGELRRLLFFLALVPVNPYRVAKLLSEETKGEFKKESILVEYSRLSKREECQKRFNLSDSLLTVIRKEEAEGRIRKTIQVNFDYVLDALLTEKIRIEDEALRKKIINAVKNFFKDKKLEPLVKNWKVFASLLASLPFHIVLSAITLGISLGSNEISKEEKKAIESSFLQYFNYYFMRNTKILAKSLQILMLSNIIVSNQDLERLNIMRPFLEVAQGYIKELLEFIKKLLEFLQRYQTTRKYKNP
ncbi:MAG: hypothetical protein DRO14_06235 [Thermoprotei archaeon]|nr:MAG: hypothetical protein DRO14_06235 [Thermoprotei archaeon]